MSKLLPDSHLDRKNILNNVVALKYLEDEVGFPGFIFENKIKYTNKMVAKLFDVELRTIERYLSEYGDELRDNGYEIITGERLQQLKFQLGTDINVGSKTNILALFNFKSVLNIGMLLVESERAKLLRKLILDIVIDVISKKSGGDTKYINQRDESYLISLYAGENYSCLKFAKNRYNCKIGK